MKSGAIIFLFLLASISVSHYADAQEDEIELVDLRYYLHQIYERNEAHIFRDAVLSGNININQLNQYGQSVLHCAARDGKTEWIEMLLALNADIDLPDGNKGWTPIVWAIVAGRFIAFKLLLQAGAQIFRPAV